MGSAELREISVVAVVATESVLGNPTCCASPYSIVVSNSSDRSSGHPFEGTFLRGNLLVPGVPVISAAEILPV